MRPIDADRLSEVLQRNFGSTGGADTLQQLIDNAPTVDAAPVVHGRWEVVTHKSDIAYYAKCDHCGYEYACGRKGIGSLIEEVEPFFHSYCPECGARMDGGEGENV